jgi:hypothetical protein
MTKMRLIVAVLARTGKSMKEVKMPIGKKRWSWFSLI